MKELNAQKTSKAPDSTAPTGRRRAVGHAMRQRVRDALAARIRFYTDRLFRDLDEQARQHGWTMETGPYGLRRSYRDPRFLAVRAQAKAPPADIDDAPERTVGGVQEAGGCHD